jgi:Amt family ammonium transporter
MSALLIGVAAGAVCYLACTVLKSRLGYDDSLDVFGIHGVGGTLGALLTGVFATRAVQDLNGGNVIGLMEGGKLLGGQIAATAITWIVAIALTYVILLLLDATMGLRVAREDEVQGLDFSQHGEEGYIFV